MLNNSKCEILMHYCKEWYYYLYKLFDDWKNPPCPECGIKKSN
jgi:hypothetical protein